MSRTASLGSEEHYQGTTVNQGLHVHQQVSEIVVSVAEPHNRRIGDITVVFVHQVVTCNGHDRSTKRVAHIGIVPEFLYNHFLGETQSRHHCSVERFRALCRGHGPPAPFVCEHVGTSSFAPQYGAERTGRNGGAWHPTRGTPRARATKEAGWRDIGPGCGKNVLVRGNPANHLHVT